MKALRSKHFFRKQMALYYPFVIAGVIIALESLFYGIHFGDWGGIYSATQHYSLFGFISASSSGRIFVDSTVGYILAPRLYLFLPLTVAATFLLLYSLTKLVRSKDVRLNIFIAIGFIVLFPFGGLLASAGPFATIINYLFPAAALAYGLTILIDGRVSLWQNILKIIAIFYATDSEELAVFAVLIFAGFLLMKLYRMIHQKTGKSAFFHDNLWQIGALLSSMAGLVIVFICDKLKRGSLEAKLYFPNFSQLSVLRKLDMGFVDTMQHLFINPFFLVCAILIIVLVISVRKKKFVSGTISAFQLSILLFPQSNEIAKMVNTIIASWNIKNWGTLLSLNGFPHTSIHSLQSLMPDFYFIVMAILFFACLLSVLDSWKQRLIVFYIVFAGFISRMILSFSPTIYASNDRTFFPMLVVLFCVLIYLVKSQFFRDEINDAQREPRLNCAHLPRLR